jgi:predicted aldo/keto reductase-like oxidoreductase
MKIDGISRRELGLTMVAGSVAAGAGMDIPRRPLGKTGFQVSILGLGSAPLGRPDVTQEEADRVVGALIDEGVNYVDTAPIYGMAEERLGKALKGRRDKVFLVTKVEATSNQDATWLLRQSLRKLQTDYLDAVHIHNVGRTDRFPSIPVLLGEDGALQALRNAKKKGLIRHIGMTCHLRPARALPVIETGDIELVMCAANFVDVHTYNFEGTVFAEAKKHGLGIVAMKILGGSLGKGARLSAPEHYEPAVRYALSIPGLSVAIMGMGAVSEVKKAVATVRSYKPFSAEELSALTTKGKMMARAWGPLRGPVA